MSRFGRLSFCILLIAPLAAGAAETDKFLPDRSEAVVTVHVKQLVESPLFKEHLAGLKQTIKDLQLGRVGFKLLGFDPFADVERLVFAFGGNPNQNQPVCLVQGTFDTAKIETAAEKAAKDGKGAVRREKVNERVFYSVKLDADDEPVYFGLLGAGMVIVAGDQDSIVEALDKKAGTRKPELRKEVQQLLAKADTRHAIAVASLSQPLSFGGFLGNIAGNLQHITGGVVLGEDIKLEIALAARDAANAKQAAGTLEERLNQAKAIVAVLVTKQKEFSPLADLLSGVRVAAKGSDVAFRVTVSKELIDNVLKKE